MKTISLLFFWSFFAIGCASTPKIAMTPSGRPEVTIASADLGRIKSAIISQWINDGYAVEWDSEYMLELTRATKGAEDFAASLVAGNATTTNSRVATFTFAQAGESAWRVVASNSVRAVFQNGRVNTNSVDGNAELFNSYQRTLLGIKSVIESGR